MKRNNQYFLYVFFAIITTLINLGVQKGMEILLADTLNFSIYSIYIFKNSRITYGLMLQILTATALAFIFKYSVDKIYIFKDKTSYFTYTHLKQLLLYGSFAVLTTIIFWVFELSFEQFFVFRNAKYTGAIIGLAVGYTVKFLLDKKYVFIYKN